MAARPSWQGHLKLSLVTCPVALYNAVSPRSDVSFNLINPDTGNRIKMVTVDAGTEEPLDRKTLVKGFEVAKGEYVIVTPEEIASVKLESTKTIDIESFVPAEDIDRLYWENPYFLVPDGKLAAEPFAVIRAAMEKAGKVALGRLVMSQRERLVALEVRGEGMIATTLRTHEEVRDLSRVVTDVARAEPDADMIAIAEKIIAQRETDFDPQRFEDRYEKALLRLIEQKRQGEPLVRPAAAAPPSNVINLMEALRASLKEPAPSERRAPATPPARKAAAAKAPARRTAGKRPAKR
jgi:DNA end-binding protein Ku